MLILFASKLTEFGIPVAITGMLIVFVSLILISTFLEWMPTILARLNQILPEAAHPHHHHTAGRAEGSSGLSPEIVAAIGTAMHHKRTEP